LIFLFIFSFRAQCWLSSRLGSNFSWITIKPDVNNDGNILLFTNVLTEALQKKIERSFFFSSVPFQLIGDCYSRFWSDTIVFYYSFTFINSCIHSNTIYFTFLMTYKKEKHIDKLEAELSKIHLNVPINKRKNISIQ